MIERSKEKQEEHATRRLLEEELDDLRLKQALEESRRAHNFIDLGSDSD